MEKTMLDWALEYLNLGLSVIPVNPSNEEDKGKKSLVKWEKYQKEKPSEEQVKEWWQKWPAAMIGAVTGEVSGIFAVDADNEEAKEQLNQLLPENFVTPTTQSPHGLHNLIKYYSGIRNYNKGNGEIKFHVRGEGGYIIVPPSQRENGLAYAWLVDPFSTAFAEAPRELIDKINKCSLYIEGLKSNEVTDFKRLQMTSNDFKMFTKGRRDEDLFHVANCMIKGYAKFEEVYQTLYYIAGICDPPFPESQIKEKVLSAIRRAERREINFAQEVREMILTSNGFIMTSDCFNRLQVTSRQEKKNVVLSLLRLEKEGLIKKEGKRHGCYRVVENTADEIDIFNNLDAPLSVRWPLGIEKLIHTMPKSIIVVAGESDSGKTGFLLNFSMLNMDSQKILYFSSEMGPTELKDRVSKFERPLQDWKKVIFKERSGNFEDVISPDCINIVDYLELVDDFYKVGAPIKAIFEKLNKGIAIIALQKKMGAELGRGGDFSMEKARLYLSLSRENICKIVKAKNWVDPMVKPAGKVRKYILLHGCKFLCKTEWIEEDQLRIVQEREADV